MGQDAYRINSYILYSKVYKTSEFWECHGILNNLNELQRLVTFDILWLNIVRVQLKLIILESYKTIKST